MRKTTLTVVIATLIHAGGLIASDQRDTGAEANAQSHSRGNAELSIGSVQTLGTASAFSRVDADGDGRISRREGEAMKGLGQQWHKLDKDNSGNLSIQEFAVLSAGSDPSRDNGRDAAGLESRTDVEAGVDAQAGAAGTGIGVENRARERLGLSISLSDINDGNTVRVFNQVDTNGDFKLDRDEATRIEGLVDVYGELDADGDGLLDYAEFKGVTRLEAEAG